VSMTDIAQYMVMGLSIRSTRNVSSCDVIGGAIRKTTITFHSLNQVCAAWALSGADGTLDWVKV
ncbi:MAG: hypothetical protein ABJD57_19475, partial [Roseibium sp.]|uniref:hypothetical protein n=1 Tax=Roseibium sp. TaxID=1936156 RepID=UPI0032637F31